MNDEKTVTIDLRLSGRSFGLVAVVLLVLGITAFAFLSRHPASAETMAGGTRQYYITDESKYPDEAPTACAAGYHFASLWEILDPSALQYDTALGQTTLDSGNGPPTIQGLGWVRTGYNFSDVSTTVGHANCALWSSRVNTDAGTVAVLPQDWTAGAQDLGIWDVQTRACNFKLGVWCVED